MKKLQRYGFQGRLLNWIEAFLTGRQQRVVVNGKLSFFAWVLSGVPQGTVLGPILFLIFINNMNSCILHSILRSFADDTRIMRAIKTVEDSALLQEDLNRVIEWASDNNMLLHQDKFEVLNHSTGKSALLKQLPFTSELYCYQTTEGTLYPQDSVKDLGVLITADSVGHPTYDQLLRKLFQCQPGCLASFRAALQKLC